MQSLLSRMVLLLLITSSIGCTPQLNLGPRNETTTIHERMGQPSKVAQDAPVKVSTMGPDGKWVTSKMRADGMMVLDRPTYELYQQAWTEKKAAARNEMPVNVEK